MPAQNKVTSFRVLPRFSAAKKTTHTRSQNNLFCLQRSQHSRHCFKPHLKPPNQRFLFRVFRVFRGEPWFTVEKTVIEQVHARLARAKAHATVSVIGVISDARGQK
jgi:capsule polysaccharide export protein KpsC/LpsZ